MDWQAEFIRFLDTLPPACVVYLHSPGSDGKTYLANSRRGVTTEMWLHDEWGCMRTQKALSVMQAVAIQVARRVVLLSNHAPESDDSDYEQRFGPGGRVVANIYYCGV